MGLSRIVGILPTAFLVFSHGGENLGLLGIRTVLCALLTRINLPQRSWYSVHASTTDRSGLPLCGGGSETRDHPKPRVLKAALRIRVKIV